MSKQSETARIHWTLLEPDATDEEMLCMDKEGYVEVAPERLAPILAELDAAHEAAVQRVIAQFGNDSHALATEIVRLRGELMAIEA